MFERYEYKEPNIIDVIKPLPISAKREILQMVNGLRPVAEITIISRFKEEMLPVVALLSGSDFTVVTKEIGRNTICFVSKDGSLAEEAATLLDSGGVTNSRRYGELMGFPTGSIESFVNNKDDLLSVDEVEKLIGFPNYFVNVSLSRGNIEESVRYLKNSYRVLLEQYPEIFEEGLPTDEDLQGFKRKVSEFVNC